ncbi:MAG: ribonuclease P protein component [Clostridia bacterium]|nr:ribonuclease P protein component [Oscillospiraceae bacterium]MBQ3523821.1 ribonuclease P protein component [Clostridia bacterium]
MKRTVTIKSNCDFRRTYGKGKSFQAPALVSYVLKNRAGICRVGITTSKKIGNAVERNRARRVIRVAYSNLESKINGNYDIVFVARSKTKYIKSTDLTKIMFSQLKQAGVIDETTDN